MMRALDDLSDREFAAMIPGLPRIFSEQRALVLLRGIALLPIGFGMQTVASIESRAVARWQSVSFLIAVLLIALPDNAEIVNPGYVETASSDRSEDSCITNARRPSPDSMRIDLSSTAIRPCLRLSLIHI